MVTVPVKAYYTYIQPLSGRVVPVRVTVLSFTDTSAGRFAWLRYGFAPVPVEKLVFSHA